MTREELANRIDLTFLRPNAEWKEIERLLCKSRKHPFASVCIPPFYVKPASDLLEGTAIKVGTVIGFPLGYATPAAKLYEAVEAVCSGAGEIDMVMNISAFKSGRTDVVEDEVKMLVSSLKGITVKVIIECCYLTNDEKIKACSAVVKGGADFIKTSTGFAESGATLDDVKLLANCSEGRVKVKAAGGISSLSRVLKMLDAGASRVGTSAGMRIMDEFTSQPAPSRLHP